MGDRWVENFFLRAGEDCSALHFLLANIRLEI